MSESKLEQLLKNRAALSGKQLQLLDYLLNNINQMSNTSVAEVAKQSGVGKATIFRMLKVTGYESFVEFKLDLADYVSRTTPPAYWQVQKMLETNNSSSALGKVLAYTTATIEMLNDQQMEDKVSRVIDLLLSAPCIGIVGCRSSRIAAKYFESILLPTSLNVCTLTADEMFTFEKVYKLPPHSVVFALARWPYTQLTIRAVELAHQLGHTIILLTNHEECQAKELASEMLVMPRIEDSYSLVPFFMAIEAIGYEICARTSNKTRERLNAVDKLLMENNMLTW